VIVAFSVSLVARQQSKPMQGHDMAAMRGEMTTKATMTKAQKIANAVSAGPVSISAKATVLDWPAKEGAKPEVLRQGNNGWTCLPDFPDSKGNDPQCVDDVWMKWFDAYLAHKTPEVTKVGIGYMQATGGGWASNTDPYAMKEMGDNHWGLHPPHVMILVPDAKALAGMPTDPGNGGPYVMWAGTPYAHIMAPTMSTGMHK
jgi:hypothetical protein